MQHEDVTQNEASENAAEQWQCGVLGPQASVLSFLQVPGRAA